MKVVLTLDPADQLALLLILTSRAASCAEDKQRSAIFPPVAAQWAEAEREALRLGDIVRRAKHEASTFQAA